jgi:hypothetical protein
LYVNPHRLELPEIQKLVDYEVLPWSNDPRGGRSSNAEGEPKRHKVNQQPRSNYKVIVINDGVKEVTVKNGEYLSVFNV